jgi:acetolactate synthase-1/2/3 large subunit
MAVDHGIADVFMLTGGGAMPQPFARHASWPQDHVHHEQALSMAAEAYARLTNRPAVVNRHLARAGPMRSPASMAPMWI